MNAEIEMNPEERIARALPEGSRVAYSYTPEGWSEERFQAAGGFAAVVLNYNKKGMITAAAESAFNQDYPCYEIWCMDDASKDGSEQEMIEAAKAYKGNQRVVVICHTKNQSIVGQWNCVSRASTANWFGMFCGDDVSLPNRISTAAEIAKEHPTLKGFCTNFIQPNKEGVEAPYQPPTSSWIWRGIDPYVFWHTMDGCATFWNRALFNEPLPRLNHDDYFLTWCAYIRWSGSTDEILMTEYHKATVRYSVGTGITTGDFKSAERVASPWKRGVQLYSASFKHDKILMPGWKAIRSIKEKYPHNREIHEAFLTGYAEAEMRTYGWWGRLWVMLHYLLCIIWRVHGPKRICMTKIIFRVFFKRVCGPYIFALIYVLFLNRRG